MSKVQLLLTGGTVFLPQGPVEATVGVENGQIAFISTQGWAPPAQEVVDLAGRMLVPGFIDSHVHFRDPGLNYKEDFTTGTMAAAAGGITTVVDMPNTKPAVITRERFVEKLELAGQRAVVDFALYAGATNLDEIPGMLDAGAIGVKIFMVADPKSKYPHDPELFTSDDGMLYDTIRLARDEGSFCAVHPTNQEIFAHESEKCWKAGTTSPQDFLKAYFGENFVSDHTAMATLIEMARAADARVHILHLRSEQGIRMIQQAKEDGLSLTMEVNPKYVLLDEKDMEKMGPLSTPYGLPKDIRHAIYGMIEQGYVDVFASDHAPHTKKEMEPGWKDAWSIPFGNPQLDHFVAALLTSVHEGLLSLETLVRMTSEAPARILGLYPKKGVIQVGSDADLTVLDLGLTGTLSDGEVYTKVGWSPYSGRNFKGKPVMTISRGRIVMRDGVVNGQPGWGRPLLGRA